MEEIDKFNGITNQEFIEYFKIDLYSLMDVINYTYPHELFDEDGGASEHIERCSRILGHYMELCYEEAKSKKYSQEKDRLEQQRNACDHNFEQNASDDATKETSEQRAIRYKEEEKLRNEAVSARKKQLGPEIGEIIEDYLSKVKVTYMDL